MQLTNKLKIPQIMVDAISFYMERRTDYEKERKADYSVTQLLQPPAIAVLKKRFKQFISKDVSDCLYLLQGWTIHTIMEKAVIGESNRYLSEISIATEIDGKIISGQPDLYEKESRTLIDYKYVSVKSAENNKEQYGLQANMYKYLLEKNNIPVSAIKIIIFYRDWNKAAATRSYGNHDYPSNPIDIINVPIMRDQNIENEMRYRIEKIMQLEASPIVRACNEEERWQNPTRYAVMKKGAKKATKVLDTREEAIDYIADKGGSAFVEERKSEPKRCINYCEVNEFCHFYQTYHDYTKKEFKI